MRRFMPAFMDQTSTSLRPGLDRIVYTSGHMAAPETIRLTSEAFRDNEPIPARFTDDGAKISPPLAFENVPRDAKSLALIVEDADSVTTSPLCHALVWDIDPRDSALQEAAIDGDVVEAARKGAVIGQNSLLSLGWLPPDPPVGQGPHRYALQIFALDYRPDLEEGSFRLPIVNALQGHILAKGLLVGTYERV
ncbi:YbhB/YbcL family Raf kinase inhibitor-like protein [Beijerinckia sp. L45]|uniref:YbhB/YbcL family Raf kinase inhibitor-like protein n=1 Tax=Beijerinckia sp. L45 TaxID=1641855 RepID=UPI00131DCF5A|nr:YbhB/YbcL family Raf kinase inhibitor-like protein [Beijerinckia sp. L45]